MKNLSVHQLKVLQFLTEDKSRFVHGSPFYNSIHVTDGKHEGFRHFFSRNTLNSLVKMKYLIFEKDYKYTLNSDLIT